MESATMINEIRHNGELIGVIDIDDEIEVPPVLQALETARTEVQSLSPTGATRQAIEALISAVEAII